LLEAARESVVEVQPWLPWCHPDYQLANLGYWVRTSQVGRGVATQAVQLLARWAFSHTDLVRLEIVVAAGNETSQRVAEKAGAAREGLLRKRLQPHRRWHDALLYSITRNGEPSSAAGASVTRA
jgi:RimJ/RimL family protein N-acetyltransferase